MSDIYHRHHILPRHSGGSDDPSNLVKLTISEHCDAHWILYVKFGNEYDRIATLSLAGLISTAEATRLAQRENGKRIGQKHKENGTGIFALTEEQERSYYGKKYASFYGKIGGKMQSIEVKRSNGKKAVENKTGIHGYTTEQITANAIKAGQMSANIERTCPHCGKTGKTSSMIRWHFDNCLQKPGNENLNRSAKTYTCPHCNTVGNGAVMFRHHFDRCKFQSVN